MTATSVVRVEHDALIFTGSLVRDQIAVLWSSAAKAVAETHRFDLTAVDRIDSAGLALLSQLATVAAPDLVIEGSPPGLSELSEAYRLSSRLAFL